MANYVLSFSWSRDPDGTEIVRDENGRPESIRQRSDTLETYRRRLATPDELIVTEFLKTGRSSAAKKNLPPEEVAALRDFVSEYGRPDWAPAGPKEDEVSLSDLISYRHMFQITWDAFEQGDTERAVRNQNRLVHFNINRPPIEGYLPELRFNVDEGTAALTLKIIDLKSFMWMETALVIAGGCKVTRCEQCSTIFQTGPGTGRRDTAMYCSNRCRVAAQRARKKPAPKRRKKQED